MEDELSLPVWAKVRRKLGYDPVVAGRVGGANSLFVERYIFKTRECSVPGQPCTALLTKFSPSPVSGGDQNQPHGRYLPTHFMLVPPGTPTHWVFSGTADFAVFYFLEGDDHLMESLIAIANSAKTPLAFSDVLVGAIAQQLVDEVQRGTAANAVFSEHLIAVLLERILRTITSPAAGVADSRDAHYAKVQVVLNYVRQNLTADLSGPALAKMADLSVTQFRSVFLDAIGIPIHRFVLNARLDQARTLLTMSAMPIARIAQECGFSSQSHLTASFRIAYAATPAQLRARLYRRVD